MIEHEIVLTIAIPTYNRASFLDENLKILHNQVLNKKWPIEIMVSNNCSIDNTEDVIKKHVDYGMCIKHLCNEINIGADKNMVQCLYQAKGKYCWILGDDDYLIDGTLEKIMRILMDGDYGLLHLKAIKCTNINPTVYNDIDMFVRKIDYWITFVSSNIVNTKYIKDICFESYTHTYFALIPLYLTAASKEKQNIIFNSQTISAAHDYSSNGGYNIFEVFAHNFNAIMKEFAQKGYYSLYTYRFVKVKLLKCFLPYYISLFLIGKNSNGNYIINNGWKILYKEYWQYPQFYIEIPKLYCKHFVKWVLSKLKIAYKRGDLCNMKLIDNSNIKNGA